MAQFSSFAIPQPILQALDEMGFQSATPVQASVIPLLLEGRDVVAQAQTGTGKTAAFGVPLVAAALEGRQSLVLAPTRELAQQVAAEIDRIGKTANVRALALYGGAAFGPQAGALRAGRHAIVVATPGRLRDHIEQGTYDASRANLVVLDEADEMLKMGFVDEVTEILDRGGPDRNTMLFSATMPEPIVRLSRRYLNTPEHVHVRGSNDSVATADTAQFVVHVAPRQKVNALIRILSVEAPEGVLAFRQTRDGVEQLVTQLEAGGVPAEALHGGMAQAQRDAVVQRLRDGRVRVLVATDVAARGLDVDTVTHVVNFDAPKETDAYVHRIGRTGRGGRTGRSFLFLTPAERRRLRILERVVGTRLVSYDVPDDEALRDAAMGRARDWLRTAPLNATDRETKLVDELIAEGADPRTLAAKLLAQLAPHAGFAPPTLDPLDAAPQKARHGKGDDGPRAAIMLAVGHIDRARPGDIVGALTNEGGLTGGDVGRIDILAKMSVAEVPASRVDDVLLAMRSTSIRGRSARPRVADAWRFRNAPRAPRAR